MDKYLCLSICTLDGNRRLDKRLYEGISTYEEAELLAQLAMSEKSDEELVVIMPGWNKGIKRYPDLYERAKLLAEEYESEWEN